MASTTNKLAFPFHVNAVLICRWSGTRRCVEHAQNKRGEEAEVDPEQHQDPDNEVGLSAGTTCEQDDEEADKIYGMVDKSMDVRRRQRRRVSSLPGSEAREKVEMDRHRAERPKIQQQFADLKRGLSAVTDEEWESIPVVGNLTRKKRGRDERSFVVPDSVLVGDRGKVEYEHALDARQQEAGGFETETNYLEIGQAGKKILALKLDQLTSLKSVVTKSDAEIGDIKCARMPFDSLVKSWRLRGYVITTMQKPS
ncbi:hypothetical protein FIBSPDRAFT_892297 [Athelia psychrophila]|uniref:PRP1 splicing factor N-terminal domain-containing protein n=1 Tax=Athelia psychrophila TaxID=1759441 RepID=A0A166IJX3_9AGAM|nr:hypothetical protein FIBSPDRAFT_892297 [Fibularhizoctonia sp. CBS 109695]